MKKILLSILSLLIPALAFAGPYDHQETSVFPNKSPLTQSLQNNVPLRSFQSDGTTLKDILILNSGDETHLMAGTAGILFDVTGKQSIGYDGTELYPGNTGVVDVGFSSLKFRSGYINSIRQSVATGLTAAGTNQGTCLALAATFNNVTTAASGTAVCLFEGTAGQHEIVRNGGANALKVCPATASGTINGGAGGACVTLSNTGAHMASCAAVAADAWVCSDAASAS